MHIDKPTNTRIKAYKFKIAKKTVIIPFRKTNYYDKMNVFSFRLKEFRVREFTRMSWGMSLKILDSYIRHFACKDYYQF